MIPITEEEAKRKFLCTDCQKTPNTMFGMSVELWLSIAEEKDVLCWNCAEKRLGRKITYNDLIPQLGLTKEMILGLVLLLNSSVEEVKAMLDRLEEVKGSTPGLQSVMISVEHGEG